MKALLWSVSSIFTLIWTAVAAVTAQIVGWAAQQLAASSTGALGDAVASLTLPGWLSPFVETATWNAWVQAIAGAATALERAFPALSGAIDWLVPIVWVGWGFGLLALLVLTFASHWALSRRDQPNRR
jgi:hypothetical protein